jgi:hypothetical protein
VGTVVEEGLNVVQAVIGVPVFVHVWEVGGNSDCI